MSGRVISNYDSILSEIDHSIYISLSKEVSFYDDKENWLKNSILKHLLKSHQYHRKTQLRKSGNAYVQKAIEEGAQLYEIRFPDQLRSNIRYVCDWLAELDQRDIVLFKRLNRVSFIQAFDHSKNWHKQLVNRAKNAEKQIPFDDEENPIIHEISENEHPGFGGWKWVWLKTGLARTREEALMGCCVAPVKHDKLTRNQFLLSLRSPDGVPHVTLYCCKNRILSSVYKDDVCSRDQYKSLLNTVLDHINAQIEAKIDLDTKLVEGINQFPNVVIYIKDNKLHREDGPAIKWADGSSYWYSLGRLHREHGPAIQIPNPPRAWGQIRNGWYQDGQLHREDGPALEFANGDMFWFKDNKIHRDDGPAIEQNDGTTLWYRNGRLHRKGGPAIENAIGSKEWYQNGKRHRVDGPAIDRGFGADEYYVNGVKFSEDEFLTYQEDRQLIASVSEINQHAPKKVSNILNFFSWN